MFPIYSETRLKMEGWRIYGGGGVGPILNPGIGQDDLSGETDSRQYVSTPKDNPFVGQMVQWVGYPGCPNICQPNIDIGPVPYGTMFPSGQTEPPAHYKCDCDLQIVSG